MPDRSSKSRNNRRNLLFSMCVLLLVAGSCLTAFWLLPKRPGTQEPSSNERHPEWIKLPAGFKLEVFAPNVPGARQMVLSPSGVLYVGTRFDKGTGIVYAIPCKNTGTNKGVSADTNPDSNKTSDRDLAKTSNKDSNNGSSKASNGESSKVWKAGEVIVLARDLFMPNGVEFRDGALYVAEVNRIIKYENIERDLHHPPQPTVVFSQLPDKTHHGWKYMRFGPDGLLYVPVGAPCNACIRGEPFAGISRIRSDGSHFESFARGIRNTVGFDWDPVTKELWFTDNGRDWLGDNLPPDELNHAPRPGMNFGFPYRYGDNVADPEFSKQTPAGTQFTPAAQCLGAHVAALGMRFYTGQMFPHEYYHQIFIAEHGSWNSSTPVGCRLTLVTLKGNRPVGYEPFAAGWQQPDGRRWGRPVDVLVMPDGALLVSDDQAGAIYRISYSQPH